MMISSDHPRSARARALCTSSFLLAFAMGAWGCGSSETTDNSAAGSGGATQGGSAGSEGGSDGGSAGTAGSPGTGATGGSAGHAGSAGSGGTESNCAGQAGFVCCSAENVLEDAQCIGDEYRCAPGLIRATSGVCEGTNGDTPDAVGCFNAGGACVGRGQCTGSVASAHNSECIFSDGPGECCLFPEPSQEGDNCADIGGVCAPIGGCGRVLGYRITTPDCNQGPFMCCIPQSQCGDADVSCCAEGMTWYASASCVRGELVCAVPDTELMRTEDCEALISQ